MENKHTNFALPASRNICAGVLDISYLEYGPVHGPVVLLMHGFPYDVHTYAEVAPILASAGCRVIVPYLQGFEFLYLWGFVC